MKSSDFAIQIIPELTIDDKYTAVIGEAQNRIASFAGNAVKDARLSELFVLERSRITAEQASQILRAKGRLVAGFQFENKPEMADDNFRIYARKHIEEGDSFKFYLTQTVQQIMLQMISLEDRRTVAIFSMLNSSLDVGYRILTALYANQLRRLANKVPDFLRSSLSTRVEKLSAARSGKDTEVWEDPYAAKTAAPAGKPAPPGRELQDNLLQVLAEDGIFDDIASHVAQIVSRSERIREKRLTIEKNRDMSRQDIYEMMIREDLDQLENCYARIHVYLKAFYKNKDKRTIGQNRVLRQFFANQIEKISGDTALLEDLLSLREEDYIRNIERHRELD
jgi:hypothetical protein